MQIKRLYLFAWDVKTNATRMEQSRLVVISAEKRSDDSFSPRHVLAGQGVTLAGGLRVVCTVYTHTPTTVHTLHTWESPSISTVSQCVFDSKQTRSNVNTDQMTLQRPSDGRCAVSMILKLVIL